MAAAICGIGRRIVGGIGKTSAGVIGRALVRARGTAAGTAAVGETASGRRQGDAGRIAGAAHLQCADGAGLPIGDGWVGVEMASAEGAATRAAMRLLPNAEADLRQVVVADDRRSERVRGGSGLGMRATETGVDSEAGAKVEAGLQAGRKGLPVSSRA